MRKRLNSLESHEKIEVREPDNRQKCFSLVGGGGEEEEETERTSEQANMAAGKKKDQSDEKY